MTAMNLYHQDETQTYPANHYNSVTWTGPNNLTLSDLNVNGPIGNLIIQGPTTLNESTLNIETCDMTNNGSMTLNRSNLDLFGIGGTGTIHVNNRSNVTIDDTTGFTSSETITLDGTSSLDIIGAPKLSFLHAVNMSQGSCVVLEGLAKITAEVYSHGVLELFGPAYHGMAASLAINVPKGTEVWATQAPNGYVTLTDSVSPPPGHIHLSS